MKRAKKPPTEVTIGEASVIVDALLLKNRSVEVLEEAARLVPLAIAEYLRVYPWTRNPNDKLWIVEGHYALKEQEASCFFCRESLNTLAWHRSWSPEQQQRFHEHGQLCGLQFLAGHHAGSAPPSPAQRKRAEAAAKRKATVTATRVARKAAAMCVVCGVGFAGGANTNRGMCKACSNSDWDVMEHLARTENADG